MGTATVETLVARNPATGAELGRVPATPAGEVSETVARSRAAQEDWGRLAWSERKAVLTRWWRLLARDAEGWADAIRDEIGKPRSEAMAGDVVSTLDGLRWTVRHGGRALRGERLGPGHQLFLQIPVGRLEHTPLGVVGMIGTWNYPLFLNAVPIAQALAAGNGVVWKPSELATLTGQKLQTGLNEAGFPRGLVAAVYGGSDVGQALVGSPIDKGFFTGGVGNGRRVLAALAERGVPGVAELSGFDAAVVLPDAPLHSTAAALTWSAFVGAGQTCVSVKRVTVVGGPRPWAEALADRARALRMGDPAARGIDLGPLISEQARARLHAQVGAARSAGAELLAGGTPADGPGWFYPATVLLAHDPRAEAALSGAFGPVVVVRGVPDADAAVAAVNASDFGLGASVWSRDTRAARALASRIKAGMVTINDAVTTTMHASAPFGGMKASGHGRTHGAYGLREFTQPRVVYSRRAGGFRPQLFPYDTGPVDTALRIYRRFFHSSA